jgi:hypothetical protein
MLHGGGRGDEFRGVGVISTLGSQHLQGFVCVVLPTRRPHLGTIAVRNHTKNPIVNSQKHATIQTTRRPALQIFQRWWGTIDGGLAHSPCREGLLQIRAWRIRLNPKPDSRRIPANQDSRDKRWWKTSIHARRLSVYRSFEVVERTTLSSVSKAAAPSTALIRFFTPRPLPLCLWSAAISRHSAPAQLAAQKQANHSQLLTD